MKVCPLCKEEFEEGSKFCRKCGGILVDRAGFAPEVIAKRQVFEVRLAQEPQNVAILAEYGDYLVSLSLYDEALVRLYRARELATDLESLHKRIVEVHRLRGDYDRAAVELHILVEAHPDQPNLREELVTVYESAEKWAEAAKALCGLIDAVADKRPYLHRLLGIRRRLGDSTQIVDVCIQLLRIEPDDLATWELLADQLLASGKPQDATRAFAEIRKRDPDNVRAALHLAIACHDEALRDASSWQNCLQLLDLAAARSHTLNKQEAEIAKLYRCRARLQCKIFTVPELAQLSQIDLETLSSTQRTLLAECFLMAGRLSDDRHSPEEAISCYESALTIGGLDAARQALATILARQGNAALAQNKRMAAAQFYQRALKHSPSDASVANKFKEITRQQRNRQLVLICGGLFAVALLVFLGAFFYYGQGSFDIRSTPAARISFFKGETLLASTEGDRLDTDLLRYGSYEVRVEKLGYETLRETLRPEWGRGRKEVKLQLTPRYGKLAVNSEPAGAKVKVRNAYQMESGVTPCLFENIFALPTTVEVSREQFSPYRTEHEVVANQTTDLGTIVFKGGLKVDSNPSGAEVSLDGTVKGTTPFHQEDLPARSFRLAIRKPEAGAYLSRIMIETGKTLDLKTVSLSNKGILRLSSKPAGARVKLENAYVGDTPLTLNDLDARKYAVALDLPGYPSRLQTIEVNPGEVSEVSVSLVGSLKIASDPSGAEIFLNGKMVGTTPATIEDLPAQSNSVEIRHLGYSSFSGRVQIEPEQVLDMGFITLKREQVFTQPAQSQRSSGTSEIEEAVARFYKMVELKRVNDAVDMYASSKRPNIKRDLIEAVAKDTEYYRVLSVNVVQQDSTNALTKVQLLHKKYRKPEERWEIDFSLLLENGVWKVWSTPGKRLY
jgi:tetratricopeptide (TPR) repeat protein